MTAGPIVPQNVGPGSLWIPRPDGNYAFLPGMATLTCAAVATAFDIFNPYTMIFTIAVSVQTTAGTGPGAFAYQRKDGQWLVVKGGASVGCLGLGTTEIYNPASNIFGIGVPLAQNSALGGLMLPRPDGTALLTSGAGLAAYAVNTNTYIYNETGGATITGVLGNIGLLHLTALSGLQLTGTNSGAVSFQRSDGKFVVITGAATTTTSTSVQIYDAGWVQSGTYKSEQFDLSPVGTKLDSNSTLIWKGNMFSTAQGGIGAEVKTAPTQAALATTSTRTIEYSGGLISPAATDTWLQINFNFRRSFPSYGGIYTDVWYNGGATMQYPQRPVVTPVLYEYKVTKDKDLINLQADGLSLFRVSSGGDIFTQTGGTINTSGADLAERYTSQVELAKGSVVAIDPQNNHGVMPSKYQYQSDILGVVSTDPGFVAGAYTKDSYPIALIGRVPVNVSTENGMIHTGDYLTAASVPGYAMKATLSGRVIGKALESLDESKLIDCPASDIYIAGRKCGTVMVFVNLIDYQGQSVDVAMGDWNAKQVDITAAALAAGLEIATSTIIADTTSQFTFGDTHSTDVLNFLENLKAERAKGVTSQSEIFTDKISAVSQVISPSIVTDILEAKNGHFGAVDGLTVSVGTLTADKIITSSISSSVGGFTMELLSDNRLVMRRVIVTIASSTTDTFNTATSSLIASVAGAFASASTSLDLATTTGDSLATSTLPLTTASDIVISFDATGNAFFAGEVVAQKVSTGALDVSGPAKFTAGLEVATLGIASSTMAILSDTSFIGRPYFTSDTGGTATVKVGARSVDVVFDREYVATPILSATMTFTASTTDENIEKVFSDDVRYAVTKRTSQGFTILLSKKATADITFNWLAFAITDSKEFTSRTVSVEPVVQVTPSETSTASTTSTSSEQATTTPLESETPLTGQAPDSVASTTTFDISPPPDVSLPPADQSAPTP